MKLYLDLCCLKRPFDDQSDARIQAETLAVESILQLVRDGRRTLINSDALRFENDRNPDTDRRDRARTLLALATVDVPNSDAIEQRAAVWQNGGVPLLDALHLASAEEAGADVFCTCDDILLARTARVHSRVRIVAWILLMASMVTGRTCRH